MTFPMMDLREHALDSSLWLAHRIETPQKLKARTLGTKRSHRASSNADLCLANGYSGIALFFVILLQATGEERWLTAAVRYLRAAASSSTTARGGLFDGLAGLLFVASYASQFAPGLASLQQQCAGILLASLPASNTIRYDDITIREYDLISGSAGQFVALSYAGAAQEADVLHEFLVWLSEEPSRWECPPLDSTDQQRRNDVGMAHGIAGVLSALCLGAPGSQAAIQSVASWLVSVRSPLYPKGWPSTVSRDGIAEGSRVAWCYGTPGVALALSAASSVLRDHDELTAAITSALEATSELQREVWGMLDHSICHGTAGNALVFSRIADHTGSSRLRTTASELSMLAASGFDSQQTFGYQAWFPNQGYVDSHDLLLGAVGTLSALLTLEFNVDDTWLAAFGFPQALGTTKGNAGN